MPATFTRSPVETERKAPGTGGKPPLGRKYTGGGGNGDDDEWSRSRSNGPGDRLRRFRMGVWVVLGGDMMFFLSLVIFFFASQGAGHHDPRTNDFIGDWHPIQLPPILFLNTAVLLLSSLTIEFARRNIFRELDVVEEWLGMGRPALYKTLPWLGVTFLLGTLFLAGQWVAWKQMVAQGFTFGHAATPASYCFFIITGFHALHLLFGVVALAASLVTLGYLRNVEFRQIAVDSLAWFWHAMGFAWIILFGVLTFG